MKTEYIESSYEDFLCERYRIHGELSTDKILDVLDKLSKENPQHTFLITLDDFGQACYTSMHSKMNNDLDATAGYDLSSLPKNCFEEDNDHIGYFTVKEEFFMRKNNFEKHLNDVNLDTVCDRQVSLFEQDIEDFKAANNDLAALVDSEAYILKVPVTNNHEGIYAFPNGYFSADLNPAENVFLARHLSENFGYELIGLGASYLAFLKTKDLNEEEVLNLIELLNKVYRDDFNTQLRTLLKSIISNNRVLVLMYTE